MSGGVLSKERRHVRSACTTKAGCSVVLLTSSFHWISNGRGMENWKRMGRVSSVLDVMGLALGE